jgi:hypothetical protein
MPGREMDKMPGYFLPHGEEKYAGPGLCRRKRMLYHGGHNLLQRLGTMLRVPLFRKLLFVTLIFALTGPANATPLPGEVAKNLVPHHALYDIRMIKRHNGKIQNIRGQMSYEWRTDCEAWTTNHHFKLAYEYPEVPVLNVISDFSTYEPFDGKSLTFTSRRAREGDLYEELRGSASLGPDKAGKVQYTVPASLNFSLSKGTVFPMAHTLALIKNLKDGKKFFNAVVFDGSDDQGPVEVNAVVSKRVNAAAIVPHSAKIDAKLLAGPAWMVRLAFFPALTPAAEADYEMNAVLNENGIISDMRVDYKDFSVTQKLIALESLKEAVCGPR